jgi:hypothetical protein
LITISGDKSACLIFPYKEEVTGSNPVTPIHTSHNPETGCGCSLAQARNHVTRFQRRCDPFFSWIGVGNLDTQAVQLVEGIRCSFFGQSIRLTSIRRKEQAMTIIFGIIAIIAGATIGAFSAAQVLIILFVGVPIAHDLRKARVLRSPTPMIGYLVAVVLHLGLLVISCWIMWRFFHPYRWGYVVGLALAILPNLRSLGPTQTNVQEFFENNAQYIDSQAAMDHLSREQFRGRS